MAKLAYTERFARYGVNISQSPRITHNQLVTLRTKQMQEEPARKLVSTILNEISSFFSGMLHVLPEKKNSMCKYYGHVIVGSWSGHLPCCGDCGVKICSPDQLRTASRRA